MTAKEIWIKFACNMIFLIMGMWFVYSGYTQMKAINEPLATAALIMGLGFYWFTRASV